MERVKWTDDLIGERMAAIDDKLDRQFEELRILREEMRTGFAELRGEMHGGSVELRGEMHAGSVELRGEMHAGFSELRAEIRAVHRQLVFVLTAFAVGVLGLLGAQTF